MRARPSRPAAPGTGARHVEPLRYTPDGTRATLGREGAAWPATGWPAIAPSPQGAEHVSEGNVVSSSDDYVEGVAEVIAAQMAASLEYGQADYSREQAASVNADSGWTLELPAGAGNPARRETVHLTPEQLDAAYRRAQERVSRDRNG